MTDKNEEFAVRWLVLWKNYTDEAFHGYVTTERINNNTKLHLLVGDTIDIVVGNKEAVIPWLKTFLPTGERFSNKEEAKEVLLKTNAVLKTVSAVIENGDFDEEE